MKRSVICAIHVKGFHCWPDAPDDERLHYLRYKHRHRFDIWMEFSVSSNEREIEIIQRQDEVEQYLLSRYGDENGNCQFDALSCEHIAEELINVFGAVSCVVQEDGGGGARVVR